MGISERPLHYPELLTIIDKAWAQVTYRTLNSAWEQRWPDSVTERDIEGFEPDESALIDKVVSMGKIMGLVEESEDVYELLKSKESELNTEELQHLQEEQHKTLADGLSSDEDEARESIPSSFGHHVSTNKAVHIFNDNAMVHFRKILQRRQWQLTLDKFLAKKAK